MPLPAPFRKLARNDQEGFGLIGLVVAIFLILLALSVAAPTVARALRRDREVEAVHRADEYVNAIRRYHIKTGAYPGSIEQLDKTNNVRYIRQKYNDPMTGKPDWRLIKVGENKTTVKGFFGQPLAGLASPGIGGSSPGSSNGTAGSLGSSGTGASNSAFGAPTASGAMSTSGQSTSPGTADGSASSSFGGSSSSSFGASTSTPGGGSGATGTGSGGTGAQSSLGSSNSGSPFLGVGLPTAGSSIIVVNEKTAYPEWEFLYDPRIEQLRAKVNIFGGGMSSASSSNLGALSGSQSNTPPSTGGQSPGMPTSAPLTPQ